MNGNVSVYVQRTSHKELHMQGVKLLTSCNTTEGHTTSAEEQGIKIKYMHKAIKWNILHVQVLRTSLE